MRQKLVPDGLDCLRRAVELNPRSAVLRVYFGIALQSENAVEEAIGHLQRAKELDPSNPQPTFQLASIFEEQGDLEAALSHLNAAVGRAPREFAVHFALGRVKVLLGRVVEASGHYERAALVCPAKANVVQAALVKLQDGEAPDRTTY